MDPNRVLWNKQQQAMQKALLRPKDHQAAVELVLAQHAMVHAAEMSATGLYSFEDAVWEGLSDSSARHVPKNAEHSIAWLAWHATRCEDITMNLLAANTGQVLLNGGWLERMHIPFCDTGNGMDAETIAAFSAAVDLQALRDYRIAVGRQTRAVIQSLEPGAFLQPVDAARLPRIYEEGAVQESERWLVDYWGSRTIGGLMGMPVTRHPFVHWNEADKVKKKVMRS